MNSSEKQMQEFASKQRDMSQKIRIENVWAGACGRSDMYQARRLLAVLEKKGSGPESVELDVCIQHANAASMLLPNEMNKLPMDQVRAPWRASMAGLFVFEFS